MKQKMECLLNQHKRRQLVERMRRHSTLIDDCEDDDDVDEANVACEGYSACELGIHYPILQVAAHRDKLHVRKKVYVYFQLFPVISTLFPVISTLFPVISTYL